MKTVNAIAAPESGLGVPPPPRLLDQVRARIRVLHYSIRTEQAYVDWIKRYILFFDKQHPRELSAEHLERFLSHLAVERNVAASTQNQAKSALLFLYKEVLRIELPWLEGVTQARVPKRLPLVLTRAEVERVLAWLPAGAHRLIGGLLYGSGLRLMEALRLRVKDVEFSRGEILVREGKGIKDRVTMLPQALAAPLRAHLATVRALHQADLDAGFGEVYLPHALARKFSNAGREWGWQYVFPGGVRSPLDAVTPPGPRAPFEANEAQVSYQRGPREFAAYAAPHTSFAVSTTSSSFAR